MMCQIGVALLFLFLGLEQKFNESFGVFFLYYKLLFGDEMEYILVQEMFTRCHLCSVWCMYEK